ncbi:MAG: DUF2568 domain-containing protein [Dermatophilaceae bacterium]|jgi:hypothetical protein|uniref:DUF2568 domain-containing protein n=1 Tax=Candidatus Phosphoribacter hodrii TaxID=2953743 RepID=A0A9D7TAD4_9MICO|nr:DUF2568 domain-containing protein [Candidatus Phosphoribacter hodrii]MBP8838614.1 DUF2568 domain-containing protein [Dermatophilaceae bacterium]HPV80162.1 DUF2568 domain-containing protein [Dermatophilaceae bacterium]
MPLAVGVLGALAFATELLLWAGVAVAVQAAVGGWLGWVLGLLVAVLVIVAWSVWMAPRASHRIAPVLRAIVAGFGCLGVGSALLSQGPHWWGIALPMGAVVMVVAELKPDRGREPSDSGGR